MEKTVIGLVEKIQINGREVIARIDTGAEHSSLDKDFATTLNLGPVITTISIKSANGKEKRPVVEAEIKIKNKTLNSRFNIADREHMKYKALIGQNILKEGFLIDPSK
ncbi:MAG: ATP-dependent zinc protease [Nanoarchaeota archaeon]|nr:ATP-dependent zinc protease [Nanoarchaeota archaeon]